MVEKKVIVSIPVYKTTPDETELISLLQCLKILSKHTIAIVSPEGLDLSFYKKIFDSFQKEMIVKNFHLDFFKNINSYNRLMLNREFYEQFLNYEYMLIHQLDAYVFHDKLTYWCEQGFDYIGAPFSLKNDELLGESKFTIVGNGGFSLRKISAFLRILSTKGTIFSPDTIRYTYVHSPQWKVFYLKFFSIFGFQNTISYFVGKYKNNEDGLFACLALEKKMNFKVPEFKKAIQFAMEQQPQKLFFLNNSELPFGCHAWMKYEYETFWTNYIK